MVAAEEKKINARKSAAHKQEDSDKDSKSGTSTKQTSGKSAKDKIVSESKSAGKVNYDEADAKEKKNMAAQEEKETGARKSAQADGAKVSGRNENSGVKDGYSK